jgi:hypothetical protein
LVNWDLQWFIFIVVPNFYVADSKVVKSNNVGATTLVRKTITIMAINIILNRDRNSTFLYVAFSKIVKMNKFGAMTLGRVTNTIMAISIIGKS